MSDGVDIGYGYDRRHSVHKQTLNGTAILTCLVV